MKNGTILMATAILLLQCTASYASTALVPNWTITNNTCFTWTAEPAGYGYVEISAIMAALKSLPSRQPLYLVNGHLHADTGPINGYLVERTRSATFSPTDSEDRIRERLSDMWVKTINHSGACAKDLGMQECVGLFVATGNDSPIPPSRFAKIRCETVPPPRPVSASCKLLTPSVTLSLSNVTPGRPTTSSATIAISCNTPNTPLGVDLVWSDASASDHGSATFSNDDKVTATICGSSGAACSSFPAHLRGTNFPAALKITYTPSAPGATARVGTLMVSYE